MRYFQMFENRTVHEIDEKLFETGGSRRGRGLLFFIAEKGGILVRTGIETPRELLKFDGLLVEGDRIDEDEIDGAYLQRMQRHALLDPEDSMHDLACEIAAQTL